MVVVLLLVVVVTVVILLVVAVVILLVVMVLLLVVVVLLLLFPLFLMLLALRVNGAAVMDSEGGGAAAWSGGDAQATAWLGSPERWYAHVRRRGGLRVQAHTAHSTQPLSANLQPRGVAVRLPSPTSFWQCLEPLPRRSGGCPADLC